MLQMGKHIITAVDRNTGGFSVTSNLQYFKQTTQIFPALKLSDSPGTEAVHTSFCANPPGSQQCIYNQPCCWGCFQAPKHTLSLQTHLFSVPKTHWAIIYCSPPQLCVWSMTGSRTLAVFSLCGKGPPVPTPPPPAPDARLEQRLFWLTLYLFSEDQCAKKESQKPCLGPEG